MATKSAPTKYLISKYADGEDCTAEFDVSEANLFPSWADQESSDAASSLIYMTLSVEAVPCEGTPGKTISFREKNSGLGFRMDYEVSELPLTGGELVFVSNIHVYRDSRWDDADTIAANETEELKARIAELEAKIAEKDAALETLGKLLLHEKAEIVRDVLAGGPEVSDRMQRRISTFEGHLRSLVHESYSIQLDLAEAGHQKDGMWAYGSRRFKVMSDQLEDYVKRYFGGFNYPTD